jgi:hypothetical protein
MDSYFFSVIYLLKALKDVSSKGAMYDGSYPHINLSPALTLS